MAREEAPARADEADLGLLVGVHDLFSLLAYSSDSIVEFKNFFRRCLEESIAVDAIGIRKNHVGDSQALPSTR